MSTWRTREFEKARTYPLTTMLELVLILMVTVSAVRSCTW